MVAVDATTLAMIVISIIVLPIAYLVYQRRRRMQRVTQREVKNEPGKPKVKNEPGKPRMSLTMPKVQNKLTIFAAIVTFIVIIVIMAESVVIVQAGYRGVVLYLGAVENRVLGEGMHFIQPFAEQVIQMEVRTLKYQADSSSASNDLQEVKTVIALNFHIEPNQANIIYQQLGADYADRIIAPTIQESVKASTAKFNAEELITKRETAKATISESIRKTLSERNIFVETVFITDFKFSDAFATQIESKVVAYQKFLTEENNLKAIQVIANQTVVQAEAQARANVAKANGEAQAITIINEQLKESPDYLKWQMINKWDGKLPIAMGQGFFPFLDITKLRQPE